MGKGNFQAVTALLVSSALAPTFAGVGRAAGQGLPAASRIRQHVQADRSDVLTYHNDNARTGVVRLSVPLPPSALRGGGFGREWSLPVDGDVYAQPLVASGIDTPALGTRRVVYVATEHDSVFAFDADRPDVLIWSTSLLAAAPGATTVASNDLGCADIVPEVGITGTPVIDRANGALFVVAKTAEAGVVVQRLHALDLATGVEKPGSPVVIQASIGGSGDGSSGGSLPFDARWQNQRCALALAAGTIYVAWAAHCDISPAHGWVIAFDAATLRQVGAFATTPDGALGGVWESGGGPAIDGAGAVYFSTGNGTFTAAGGGRDFGDTVIKMSPPGTMTVADFFTPPDQQELSDDDLDLGSGGIVLLPDQPGPHPHELLAAGKAGTVYLLDRDDLGRFGADSGGPVQTLTGSTGGIYGTPAVWGGKVFIQGQGDALKAFALDGGTLSTSPVAHAGTPFGFPGATPSVSVDSTGKAVVWVVQTDAYGADGPAVLHAYDADDLGSELYSSAWNQTLDNPGPAVKFAVPTISGARVYVGARGQVSVYGMR